MEKTTKLEIKMTQEEKDLIKESAAAMGMKMGPWVLFKLFYENKNGTGNGGNET